MRSTLALTATVLALAWAAPASAMCGSGQTTGSTASVSGSGMMCGMGQRAATDPMADNRTPSQQSAQGGCPCCRNMAMMQGMGGMMGGQRPAQPSQPGQQSQPSTPSTPAQPSMPDMPGMTPRPQ